MDLWYPPADQAPLHEWWSPLLLAADAARLMEVPWPIHIGEFMLMGRVDRSSRPAIWIYKHKESRRELAVDVTGQTYKYTATPNARSTGRFTPCDIRVAVLRADLPAFVRPVWYHEPSRWQDDDDWLAPDADEGGAGEGSDHAARPVTSRRRGHLTVIQGGRQAG